MNGRQQARTIARQAANAWSHGESLGWVPRAVARLAQDQAERLVWFIDIRIWQRFTQYGSDLLGRTESWFHARREAGR